MPESPWASFLPILRCPGLPYTKYGCAGASRLGKKSSPRHGARSPYFAAAACHTQSMAVPGRLVLAKNPAQGTALVPHTSLRRLAIHKVRLCRGADGTSRTPSPTSGRLFRQPARPFFTGRFSVAILPEVWYNRTNVGRQVCLCGYWASIPASPLWASG